jgi:hypothetical protein
MHLYTHAPQQPSTMNIAAGSGVIKDGGIGFLMDGIVRGAEEESDASDDGGLRDLGYVQHPGWSCCRRR